MADSDIPCPGDSGQRNEQPWLQLASWLEANGEDSAASSLREGLGETLTVLRLGLPTLLSRTFATTNAIENMMAPSVGCSAT
jgi:putative transposase